MDKSSLKELIHFSMKNGNYSKKFSSVCMCVFNE